MDSITITLIFFLGGMTFLVNWFLTIYISSQRNKDNQSIQFQNFVFLLKLLLISIPGVLVVGVCFVLALMLSHGV